MEVQNNVLGSSPTQSVPILVKILSWLFLIGGIIELLGSGLTGWLFAFSGAGIFAFFGIVNLVSAVANIIVSFGLRKMKKWALYTITFFTTLSLLIYIYELATSALRNSENLIVLLITVIITIYLWTIRKQFN